MAIEVFTRNEIKYFITQEQVEALFKILPLYMQYDEYNKDGKTYKIKNLYLDTKQNLLIQKAIENPEHTEKLRLRCYGTPNTNDKVYLEIKEKQKSLVNKRRTPIILSEAYEYIKNKTKPQVSKLNTQVFNEIDDLMNLYTLEPKVVISYERLAFFEKQDSDFRLTLDTNINTQRQNLFLESDIIKNLLIEENLWLMEAKAFKAFPLWFVHFLAENKINSVSFSKYETEYMKYLKDSLNMEVT